MNTVKLTGNCCDNTIAASELKNGQIAAIVSNFYANSYNGYLVCRHSYGDADHLTVIGRSLHFSNAVGLTGDKCRVRVLKAGEQITVC